MSKKTAKECCIELLSSCSSIDFKDAGQMVEKMFLEIELKDNKDIDKLASMFSHEDVVNDVNIMMLNMIRSTDPDMYGELVNCYKRINEIFIKTLTTMVVTSKTNEARDFTEFLKINKENLNKSKELYDTLFFESQKMEKNKKELFSFNMDEYKK